MKTHHRKIDFLFQKCELLLYHDAPTSGDVIKARFHLLDALDLMMDGFKRIEHQLSHKNRK